MDKEERRRDVLNSMGDICEYVMCDWWKVELGQVVRFNKGKGESGVVG
jgi:hypothetical protein